MTIPSWARVGEKVACVFSHLCDDTGIWASISEGQIYTIAGVEFDPDVSGSAILQLVERPSVEWFSIDAFRPLTTTKTQAEDVAMIRSLIKDEVNA